MPVVHGFSQVELFDPHEPFYCTEKYHAMYGDTWKGPQYDWPKYEEVAESPEAVETHPQVLRRDC